MRLLLISFIFIFPTILKAQSSFPYKISKNDWIIAPVSAATLVTGQLLGRNVSNLSLEEIQNLERQDIIAFDRNATYNWSTSAQEFSDITEQTLRFAPLLYIFPIVKNKTWNNGAALGLMYAEVLMLNTGITGITKSLTQRIRPYLYNTTFSSEERFAFQGEEAPEARTSFFSGHSSTAFSSAVFLSKTFTDIYGKTTWSKVIWIGSLSLATATAIARVEAGVHFPTDVIVGAVVGSAVGYLIPVLHKVTSEKLSFSIFPNQVYVAYKL